MKVKCTHITCFIKTPKLSYNSLWVNPWQFILRCIVLRKIQSVYRATVIYAIQHNIGLLVNSLQTRMYLSPTPTGLPLLHTQGHQNTAGWGLGQGPKLTSWSKSKLWTLISCSVVLHKIQLLYRITKMPNATQQHFLTNPSCERF